MYRPLPKGTLNKIIEAVKVKRPETNQSKFFQYSKNQVRDIRETLGLTQDTFSRLMMVSKKTVQDWEQGRTNPEGVDLAMLKILINKYKRRCFRD